VSHGLWKMLLRVKEKEEESKEEVAL